MLRRQRRRVEQLSARDSQAHAIALCSDALNEGLNLQGAAALVHLDLPTTLRVAEQRVGRVDRMDSPHDQITVWWPEDGEAFATREIELLLTRHQASESLLGSNLPMPTFGSRDEGPSFQSKSTSRALTGQTSPGTGSATPSILCADWYTARKLSFPPDAYSEPRHTRHRVVARLAPVAAKTPWAFLALSGTQRGAPRWLMLEGNPPRPAVGVGAVAERLRVHLARFPSPQVSPRRGERVAPPAAEGEWEVIYGNNDAAKGWEELCRTPGSLTERFADKALFMFRAELIGGHDSRVLP